VKLADRRLRTVLAALRAECPTAMHYPVRVRKSSLPTKWYGWTNYDERKRRFTITLKTRILDKFTNRRRAVTYGEMQDCLMHEWAHAMAWTPEHSSVTDHDAAWGVAYSRTYAAVVED
jgi:hypothetical protein